MPIYMDRHDVSETVTAEHVAQLHQEDLKVQAQFDCRGLTYWFDEKRRTAFCLIEAPDMNAIHKMHAHAHGQVPHQIIEVEASIVESFLGRIEDPEKAKNTGLNIINDPAFRTVLVVSLNRMGRPESDPLKSAFRDMDMAIRKVLKECEGVTVDQSDYQYLVSFKSVTKAVQAALAIQMLNKKFSKELMKDKVNVKMGLSAGVPVTKKQLIFEDTIKLAERMCEIVNGEIMVTVEVRDLYKSENANSFIKGRGIITLSPDEEKFITGLMDFADSSWSKVDLKVEDFTRPLGFSKSQLYRKMISVTGKSPNMFIKDYRLNEALKLLRKNTGNISEIAFETGFSSPSYFSKCFQKRYGHSPSDYLHAAAQ